jgi:hypothetical protein
MGSNERYLPPGAGNLSVLGGLGVHFKIRGDQTGGAFAIVEHPIEPHVIVEPHVHGDEDELSYVVAGTIWARVGGVRPKPCPAPTCGSHAESCTASGTRVRSRRGCSRSSPRRVSNGYSRILQGSSALLNLVRKSRRPLRTVRPDLRCIVGPGPGARCRTGPHGDRRGLVNSAVRASPCVAAVLRPTPLQHNRSWSS